MDNERLVQEVARLQADMDNVKSRCLACWGSTLPELERRLRGVETKIAYWCGALAVLQVLLTLAAKYIH
jgi:hypothetical protein